MGNDSFFDNDINGDSKKIPFVELDTDPALAHTIIRPRTREKLSHFGVIDTFGMPGMPFEQGIPNPPKFWQGEDIIFDAYLFFEGKAVTLADTDVEVIVKTSPRALKTVWHGVLDNGVYQVPNKDGFFLIWLPYNELCLPLAGSYFMDVILKERIGEGQGVRDRIVLLDSTIFNLEYSAMSEHPETVSKATDQGLGRENVENTWPNTPNTIGR